MATTRLQLQDSIRRIIQSVAKWPDATIQAWINEAIYDYSTHFRVPHQATLLCVAGQREYPITTYQVIEVLHVEYPYNAGTLQAKRYLERLNRFHPSFFDGPYYDYFFHAQSFITIVLGESPLAAQGIGILVERAHTLPTADSTPLTVPDHHVEVLRLFCVWRSYQQLVLEHSQLPTVALDPATHAFHPQLANLEASAARAERAYRNKLSELKQRGTHGGPTGPWTDSERIY
jgi:hypothetical protein